MTKKILMILAVIALIAVPAVLQGVGGFGYGNGNGTGYGNGNGNGNGDGNGNGGGSGNGNGNGYGYGNGNGPIHNILEGTPFTYSGTVVSIDSRGSGMVIATSDGNITVYGLGPQYYWDNLETDRPDIGEQVVVNGYTVDYNGTPRNILTTIEIDGVTVQLRDSETGLPLWSGNNNGHKYGSSNGNRNQFRYDILNGIPFTFAGDVVSIEVSGCGGFSFGYGSGGDGMVIATAEGNVTVDGLGPQFYWDSLGIARPTVGDYVEVTGYTVEYNGSTVNILMTVTINGQTVPLRDPETALPLWRRTQGAL
jgi:hypothetical protein